MTSSTRGNMKNAVKQIICGGILTVYQSNLEKHKDLNSTTDVK